MLNIVKTGAIGAFASFVIIAANVSPASASFDGNWSVNIVTTRGVCDVGLALPILISDGRVASGHSEVGVTGRVGQTGGITVTVIQGIKRAFGIGKLAEASGQGTWRGGPCSGTWTATKS